MERKNVWTAYTEEDLKCLEELCAGYRAFLDHGKTERECVKSAVKEARAAGYISLEEALERGTPLSCGDKIYAVNMQKAIALFQIGSRPLSDGMRILGAHIDSPRLDLKQNPLYEDTQMAYLDTHYYGGVKKYQWVTIPLAIHGVVAKKDGSVLEIEIGEDPQDPILCITDLLIHLSQKQLEKRGSIVIEGEDLDVLVGSRPVVKEEENAGEESAKQADDCADAAEEGQTGEDKENKAEKATVVEGILRILREKYNFEEEDFLSAELEIVPAGNARDCGLDRSMIAGYGQDDRVCAYTSLKAMLRVPAQEYTSCCLLVDKEEIGSVGATGMTSRFFENTCAELLGLTGSCSDLQLRRMLGRSKMLSSDVSAAYDPLYASAFERRNAAYFGRGLVFNKYTGARGKSGSNDANAEYVAWIRKVMDDANVAFQTAELGRVDLGGGGTIAYISAVYGMDVIDSGVAVLSMHAPMEITSKADIFEAEKGYAAFLQAADF